MFRIDRAFLFVGLVLLPLSAVSAQLSGSRGGVSGGARPVHGLQNLSPEVAQGYITIEGQVELRVKPTEIRVVLAVTAEGKTPSECKQLVGDKIKSLTTAWRAMGIAQDNIVEDFISVLPRYEFQIEKVIAREVAVEKKIGYLMQSNMHLAVKDDRQAMAAIDVAFENGVSDIIAFDYWSKKLDQMKVQARSEAVKAARGKSDVLLGALFDKRPPLINLQEATQVHYPDSQYESFTNSSDTEYRTSYSRRDMPQIRAFRPKNTYYRGLQFDGDVQSKDLPMQSEISVVSTVRLYFESPVAKEYRMAEKDGK